MSPTSSEPTRPLEPQKRAIIVGASSGIGEALAEVLANEGYFVAVVARREALLAGLCERINSSEGDSGRAIFYAHNVTRYEETQSLFQQITRDLGGLDLIVYAAAIQSSMTEDEYDFEKDRAMIKVNLLGAIDWLDQAAFRFEREGAGHIVGISSLAGDRGRRMNPGYNSSKAGLDTYLEGLRNRLSRYGVSVTTIKPGFVDTRLLENAAKTMWVQTPKQAAKQIYKAIIRKKQVAYVPGRMRFVSLVIRHIPSPIFRRLNI
jgi:NAD(P)-dependent dehydrogenase (short-subunit alcohol dehydrogenase family)